MAQKGWQLQVIVCDQAVDLQWVWFGEAVFLAGVCSRRAIRVVKCRPDLGMLYRI